MPEPFGPTPGYMMSGTVIAEFGLLVLFPFLMAYAAASDLLTMLIPNRISLALVAGFAVLAASGLMTPGEIGLHVGAAALVLTATFTLFALNIIGAGMPSSRPRRPCGSASTG